MSEDKTMDAVLVSGCALVIIGCGLWSHALGFVVAGALMVVGALTVGFRR